MDSVSVAPRLDCITTRVAICRPISFWHLYQARDDNGRGRREGRANGVSNRREILFLPAPEFHTWHDPAREPVLARSRAGKISILSEIPVFERLRNLCEKKSDS